MELSFILRAERIMPLPLHQQHRITQMQWVQEVTTTVLKALYLIFLFSKIGLVVHDTAGADLLSKKILLCKPSNQS